jgi:hypothetical protein
MPYIKRSAVWPDPRVKPPFGSVEIDWSHPLAQRLVSCFLLNEGGGPPLDLATGLRGLLVSDSATVSPWSTRAAGSYFKSGGTNLGSFGTSLNAADDAIVNVTSENFTIVVDVYPHPDDETASPPVLYASHRDGPGWQVRRSPNAAAALEFNTIGSGSGTLASDVNSLIDGRLQRCVVARAGTTGHIYIDGIEPGYSVATSLVDPGSVSTPYCIAGSIGLNGACPADGVDRALFYRNRALSQSDAMWLAEEPYAFLRPIVRRRYSVFILPPPSFSGFIRDDAFDTEVQFF